MKYTGKKQKKQNKTQNNSHRALSIIPHQPSLFDPSIQSIQRFEPSPDLRGFVDSIQPIPSSLVGDQPRGANAPNRAASWQSARLLIEPCLLNVIEPGLSRFRGSRRTLGSYLMCLLGVIVHHSDAFVVIFQLPLA